MDRDQSRLGALVGRQRTGEGAYIDVSMLDSAIVAMGWIISNVLLAGEKLCRAAGAGTGQRAGSIATDQQT